jgi:hypothetical protein
VGAAEPRYDLLLAVMGAPHVSDMTTTVLRLAQAVLDRGGRVQVWTCGYATMLTQLSLGDTKPRNVIDWSTDSPSAAALVTDMLAASDGRLSWCACRFCSAERGAAAHIEGVRVRPPFKFGEHVAGADRTLFVGVI